MMKATAGIYFWKQCKDRGRASRRRYLFFFLFFFQSETPGQHLKITVACVSRGFGNFFATKTVHRFSTPAVACSPCCCLATHSQASAAVPPDNSAASFPPAVRLLTLILHMNIWIVWFSLGLFSHSFRIFFLFCLLHATLGSTSHVLSCINES